MGATVVEQLEDQALPAFWSDYEAAADNMGATIAFRGFRPEDLMNPKFRKFLKIAFHTVHHQEELLHESIYTSKHHEVVEYVQKHRDNNDLDTAAVKEGFNKFFQTKGVIDANSAYDSSVLLKLEAAGRLRHPIGWALMMQFTKEGMFMTITPSITNEAMGPVESLTYGLKRDAPDPTVAQMQDILTDERRVLKQTIGLFEELPLAA